VDGASDSSYTDSAGMDQGRLKTGDIDQDQGAIDGCGDDVEDPSL